MREKDTQESPLRSPGFVVSAIGVAVLIVAAIVVVVTSLGDHHGTARTSRATSRAVAARTQAKDRAASRVNDPRGCDLPAGDQTGSGVGTSWRVDAGRGDGCPDRTEHVGAAEARAWDAGVLRA